MSALTQSDNMEAIHRFMMKTPVKTGAAQKIKDDWLQWWYDLSWLARSVDPDAYREARNRRNAFLRANATTDAERAAAEEQIRTGLTTEELEGGERETTETGDYKRSSGRAGLIVAGLLGAIGVLAIGRMLR